MMKKWFEIWLPALVVIGIFLGCTGILVGFVADIFWMKITGVVLLGSALIAKQWII